MCIIQLLYIYIILESMFLKMPLHCKIDSQCLHYSYNIRNLSIIIDNTISLKQITKLTQSIYYQVHSLGT